MRADRFAGGAMVVAGLATAVMTSFTEILPNQPTLSARFFPYLLSLMLVIGGLALVWKPNETALGEVVSRLVEPRGIAVALAFLLYATTFRHVDFRLGTWGFVLFTMWVLGARRWSELLIVPLATAVIVYMIFRHGFTVLLPTWI